MLARICASSHENVRAEYLCKATITQEYKKKQLKILILYICGLCLALSLLIDWFSSIEAQEDQANQRRNRNCQIHLLKSAV